MEQTTFLCWAFCIIMMPEGQLIHWNLFSVGGGKPKIEVSDCHTIGLDCNVQLCSEPVCLSFNWLLHGCQPIRCIITGMWAAKRTTKIIPNSFQKYRVKKLCIYGAWCAAALNSSSKCIPFLITIMPQWQSSKLRLYSCRYEQRQPQSHPSTLEERNKGRRRETAEQTVNSRAVLVNYWGTSVIKHPSTSEGYYVLPIPSRLFSDLIRICKNSWM